MYVVHPQVDCSSAKELLDALSPIGPFFSDARIADTWLFRGQKQDYPLVPSACRNLTKSHSDEKEFNRNLVQIELEERDNIVQFFEIADKRGLILPDDSQLLRSTLETLRSEKGDYFIGKGYIDWKSDKDSLIFSLRALAQHYGIPTQLLDWTRQSFIAAYFAAEGVYKTYNDKDKKPLSPTSQLVIWAFYFPLLGRHNSDDKLTDPIRIVTAPSATNPNLKAQQGVFTYLSPWHIARNNSKLSYPFMDELLEEIVSEYDPSVFSVGNLISNCRLRKFTLPVSQADELLYLLAKMDITPSAVYPGFQSIIRDLEMQKQMDLGK